MIWFSKEKLATVNIPSRFSKNIAGVVSGYCRKKTVETNTFSAEKLDEYRGSTRSGNQLVSSPNFPLGYAVRGEVYTYRIWNIDPGGYVRLVFTDWDLSPYSRITVSIGGSRGACPARAPPRVPILSF